MAAFIGEILGELLAPFVLLGLAFLFGSGAFLLVRLARLSLRHIDRRQEVAGADGALWLVAVPVVPPALRSPLSERMFGMRPDDRRRRRRQGLADDAVATDELAHPRGLVDKLDDAAGCVAPLFLAAIAVGLVFLLAEIVVVVLLALTVGAYRLLRSRWVVVTTDPQGRRANYPVDSLEQARDLSAEISADLRFGRHQRWNP